MRVKNEFSRLRALLLSPYNSSRICRGGRLKNPPSPESFQDTSAQDKLVTLDSNKKRELSQYKPSAKEDEEEEKADEGKTEPFEQKCNNRGEKIFSQCCHHDRSHQGHHGGHFQFGG